MAALNATRGAQWPLVGEFTFSIGDTMKNTSGVADAFATFATSHTFDVINLPQNAVVIGGDIVTETAIGGSTAYNVTVGDSASANRYLSSTDKKGAWRTALVPTGYVGLGENIRLTVTPTVADATSGKITLRVLYTIRDKTNEMVPN